MLMEITVWDNVWGFDYTPLKHTALTEPLVDTVDLKALFIWRKQPTTRPLFFLPIDYLEVYEACQSFSKL